MLTSLDLTDSVTDLTSSDSSVKTLADTETSREPEQSDVSVSQREWTQSERKENSQISEKIVTEV